MYLLNENQNDTLKPTKSKPDDGSALLSGALGSLLDKIKKKSDKQCILNPMT